MARHLVTGGAGFIGSSLAEALLAKGERVRILDDLSSGSRANVESLRGDVEFLEGTIVDPATVTRAMEGVDVVFHHAAIPSVARSVSDPQATMLAGVQGTTIVLDAARRAGVRRVVFAASSAAYGDAPTLPKVETMTPAPLSPYAVSKLCGEELLRVFASLHGLETVSLRYFNVFGPRQDPQGEYAAVIPRFVQCAIQGTRPIVFGDGEQTRDFCFIDNVVSANLLAAASPKRLRGEVVNIACGVCTSLNELLRGIAREAVRAGHMADPSQLVPDYRERRPGDVRDSLGSIDAARALLGYEPLVGVQEGISRTYGALREKLARA